MPARACIVMCSQNQTGLLRMFPPFPLPNFAITAPRGRRRPQPIIISAPCVTFLRCSSVISNLADAQVRRLSEKAPWPPDRDRATVSTHAAPTYRIGISGNLAIGACSRLTVDLQSTHCRLAVDSR